jgi:2-dehydro-3-deoxy-L-rhamnonate dehydrogenase (NAD+)
MTGRTVKPQVPGSNPGRGANLHAACSDAGRFLLLRKMWVNLASIAGKEGNATAAHYSAAKAGVTALTKAMAKESLLGDIRINAVAPAAVDTELFSALPLESQKIAMSRIPLGRAGTVDEVAALIACMASEECSFTTGFTFDASGGRATY